MAGSDASGATPGRGRSGEAADNGWSAVSAPPEPLPVATFDVAAPADAAAELMACCTSRRWVAELVRGRPYATVPALVAASAATLDALPWGDVLQALSVYPRVDEQLAGDPPGAAWFNGEESAAGRTERDIGPDSVDDDLYALERAYEARFGHVFLICAHGLSAARIVEQARRRLTNDPRAERAEVAAELGQIVRLRLAAAFR